MKKFQKTAIAVGVAQMLYSGMSFAQAPAPAENRNQAAAEPAVVVVSGQRAALNSAQKIKQNSDEIVDSIVADDIGKLPDRSVTEVLQRVVGVAIDRTMSKGDPEHYSVEGSGVTIRGLTYVRSEMNGRDSFSANGGRSLNFEDVPPELMAGVDVYKNPSAEQTEGAIGGLVNLRTALPFDYKGFKGALSAQTTYSTLKRGKASPSFSGLISNRWKTDLGEFGALIDLAHSDSVVRTDAFQVEPYYPRTDVVPGKTVWIPKGAQWRTLEFDRQRQGAYAALQWKKDSLRSSLTYFKSKYEMQWDEQAIFAQSNGYNIMASPDSTYDERGALLTGTLSNPADKGIAFGDDVRTATRASRTTDLAWNLEWKPNNSWTFTSDLQAIKADTRGFDSTVATGVQMPQQKVDLTGSIPRLIFNDADRAFLANPANYFWAFTMDHRDIATADSKAWKGDAKFSFDNPILRDVRFGVRLTEREARTENSNPSYNWTAITQPWQVGWDISKVASLGDPRFAGNTRLHTFPNFFNGKYDVPAVVFPDVSQAQGFPNTYVALHKFHDILCAEQRGSSTDCAPWKAATFGGDHAGVNDQQEKTKAAYAQLRFGFDDLPMPIDGNIGLRYVKTDMTAHGFLTFVPDSKVVPPGYTVTGPTPANIPAYAAKKDVDNSYHNLLPSLNLRMKATDTLQFRLAYASALSRPDFSQLQSYTTLEQKIDSTTVDGQKQVVINSVTRNGKSDGNPMLKPTTSRQVDLTAEWYFAPAGSLTFAVFNKQLKDIIVNQLYTYQLPDSAGKLWDFDITAPVNGAKGRARGFELAYQQYFDKLPGLWSGFGMQVNFTFVDSSRKLYNPIFSKYCSGGNGAANLNLNFNGCDVNGVAFGDLPLQNLSRRSANFALMYDKGPLSGRLAYSWRSKSLQAVNVNGTQGGDATDTNPASPNFGKHDVGLAWGLPTWADDYGQLDASIFYKFSDSISIGLEAQNITDAKYKQLMDQHIGTKGRAWFVSGPRYTAQMRYTF